MKKLTDHVQQYLLTTLGIQIVLYPWKVTDSLPAYLRESYQFYSMRFQGRECVFMAGRENVPLTPAVISKQVEQVRMKCGQEVVYGAEAITAYDRKRLIEQKVPFVIPGNQMYLPFAGLDLRKHLHAIRLKKPIFSPATQMLVLYVLYQKEAAPLTPAKMAGVLGFSAMTMTRAFDELEGEGIGEHSVAGKRRCIVFTESKKVLWAKVLPFLRTPVQARVSVMSLPMNNTVLAGASALARFTMLNEPGFKTVAITPREWMALKREHKDIEIPFPEKGSVEIEIWKYSPQHFVREGCVDRLSLYLSLKDSSDERVQLALENLLGGMPW